MSLRADCQWVSVNVVASEKQQFAKTLGVTWGQSAMSVPPWDLGCGWGLRSQRAFNHPFLLGLEVEDAVFFRISDFAEGHPVDVGIFRGQQEEEECGQTEGPGASRQPHLRRKRQVTGSCEILSPSTTLPPSLIQPRGMCPWTPGLDAASAHRDGVRDPRRTAFSRGNVAVRSSGGQLHVHLAHLSLPLFQSGFLRHMWEEDPSSHSQGPL